MMPRATACVAEQPQDKKPPPPLPGDPINFETTEGHVVGDEWVVERVLDRRIGLLGFEYKVRWQSWADDWDEFVPAQNIDPALAEAYDAEHPPTEEEKEMAAALSAPPPAPSRSAVKAARRCARGRHACRFCARYADDGALSVAAEKKLRWARLRVFKSMSGKAGEARLRLHGFDAHRFEDLLEFFEVAKLKPQPVVRAGGTTRRSIVVDDPHEIASYLRLQEFDTQCAFGSAAITSAEAGSVTFIHLLKFVLVSALNADYIEISAHAAVTHGDGEVECGPTLTALAEKDAMAKERIAMAVFIGRHVPERLAAAGVGLAQRPRADLGFGS